MANMPWFVWRAVLVLFFSSFSRMPSGKANPTNASEFREGSDKSQNEQLLNPAKTYVYVYEGIVMNGLPENGLNKAGLKIGFSVQLGSYGQKEFLAQIFNVDVKEYHGQWPRDPFTRCSKLTQTLEDQLKKPFKFEYHNGRVGDIFAADGVSNIVVNIIRGMLSMMNAQVRKSQNVYDLEEDSLAGKCLTRYLIQKDDRKSNSIIVIKSRDLDRCEDRAVKRIGMPFAEPCRACQQKSRHLRRLQTFTYRLRYKGHEAIIDEIRGREQIQFAPFHELYGAAFTEVRQVLTLKEIKSSSMKEPRSQLDNHGGLKYHFGSEVFQMPVHLLKSKNLEPQISDTLQYIVQNSHQEVPENSPAKLLQLIQLLRDISPENLPALLKQYSDRPQFLQWIIKAIPLIGTPEALTIVKKNIPNQSAQEAALAITLAMQYTRASPHAMQNALDLLQDSRVQDSPVLLKAALLGYGSLVNKFCTISDTCPDSYLQYLHDFAAEAANKGHIEDTILALKALSNAAQLTNVKRILKFVPAYSPSAFQLPVRVQVEAVMALRNAAKRDPKRVQEILLQVILNRRVHTEVRMAAAAALLESRPSAATVTTLALAIQKESKTNLQMASFVYSHMKSLTKSTVPEAHELNAACNVAIKILNPALDKLSWRYSKFLQHDTFNYPLMSGATFSIMMMNNPTTTLPVHLIFKLRGYVAGGATDIIEFGVRTEGLQEVLRKQNIPFTEYSIKKNIIKILKTVTGFRSLPSEVPLISTNFKMFGQNVHYDEITRETIQNAFKAVNEPAAQFSIIRKIIKKILGGLIGQWAYPVLLTEARHIVPTSMGLPLEIGLHSAALANAAVNIDMKANPTPSSDVSIAQLLQSAVQIHADLSPSFAAHVVATMGVNTALVQSAVEFHANGKIAAPAKLNIKFDGREQNFKIETEPTRQEKDIVTLRTQAFAVSRNAEELDAAKKTPIVPKGAEPNILQKHFEISEKSSAEAASMMEGSSELTAKKFAYPGETGQHQYAPSQRLNLCIKIPHVPIKVCLNHKGRNAASHKNTRLYQLVGEHEVKFTLKPVTGQKEPAIEKLQLEFTAGPRAVSKIIALTDLQEKEAEHMEESEALAKLKTILGIDIESKATNTSLRQTKVKQHPKKHRDVVEAKRIIKQSSSSSSSSSASSSSSNAQNSKQHQQNQNRQHSSGRQHQDQHHNHQQSSSSSSSSNSGAGSSSSSSSSSGLHKGHNHGKGSSSHSSSSSSSQSNSRNSQHQNEQQNSQQQSRHTKQRQRHSNLGNNADNEEVELYQQRFRRPRGEIIRTASGQDNSRHYSSSHSSSSSSSSESSRRQQPHARFLGEHKSPSWVVTAQAVRSDNKKQGYQIIVFSNYHSSKPKLQAYVVDITKESRWRACINGEVENQHQVQAEVKWGQNCQQYKVAFMAETGRFGTQPALRLKVNWPRIPSKLKSIGQVVSRVIPGVAYMLGFSEKFQKNPSRQAKIVLSLINPRTMNVVLKVPQVSMYYEAVNLPVPITAPWKARPADIHVPTWNAFADIHNIIADRLQGRCLISKNMVTTLNDVSYQYTMPGSCSHILAQDCTDEYKFLVKAKNSIENAEHKDINVQLGDFNIDIYSMSGISTVKVNGIVISKLPYVPSQDMKMEEENGRITLSAPELGIEKLYYDGKSIEVLPTSFMRGKMCGLCGRYDDETEQEFKRPDGSVAKDADSFGHSWLLAEEVCSGTCKLDRSLVRTEKPEHEDSKCYSIHPVLRCAEGCTATSTTPVSVGLHCRSTELEEGQNLDDMPEDATETLDAHTACSLNA